MTESKRKAIVFDLNPPTSKPSSSGGGSYTPACLQPQRRHNVQTEEAPPPDPAERLVAHLQPELLTQEYLRATLAEAGHPSTELSSKSQEDLVQLFLACVTSKPQRQYRDTRFGKVLSRSQERCRVKREAPCQLLISKGGKAKTQGNTGSVQPKLSGGVTLAAEERLQPAPFTGSYINTSRKTIKLGGGASSSAKKGIESKLSSINITAPKAGEKRKISFSSGDEESVKSPSKIVVINKDKLTTEDCVKSPSKKVVLNKDKLDNERKRKLSISSDDSPKKLKTSEEEVGPEKKKMPVGWP